MLCICRFCSNSKKTFSSRAMLDRHVQLRHSTSNTSQDTLTVRHLLCAPKGSKQELLSFHLKAFNVCEQRADEAESSSEQDGGFRSRRRRRAAVKTERDAESTDRTSPAKRLRSSSSAPAPSDQPDSGFSCAPCGFTTEDKAAFTEHISQHRRGGTEGGDLQCVHCGACFTSTSSLSRHLFITHKVRDEFSDGQQDVSVHSSTSSVNVKNHDDKSSLNGSDSASPPTGQGKDEDGSFTCKVCGKHFEKATDLNTHFRTHGMAFINARNAGKTS